MRLIGISGSLRAGSYNTALLRAAQGMTPEGVELVEGSIRGIPLYDGDVEAQGRELGHAGHQPERELRTSRGGGCRNRGVGARGGRGGRGAKRSAATHAYLRGLFAPYGS